MSFIIMVRFGAVLAAGFMVGCAAASAGDMPRTPARSDKSWSVPPKGGAFTPAIQAWVQQEPERPGPEPDPTEIKKAIDVPKTKPGLQVSCYEHEGWPVLQDFEELTPIRSEVVEVIGLRAIEHREDFFALKFDGVFMAPAKGMYTFALASDDGSVLDLHGERVVDNDGGHSVQVRTGKVLLEKGAHPLQVQFFEDDGGQHLELEVRFPDGTIRSVAGELIAHAPEGA